MMNQDTGDRESKKMRLIYSLYNYAMGALWTSVGIFFLIHEKFGFNLGLDKVLVSIFGVSAIMYGLFRIYRGYAKK